MPYKVGKLYCAIAEQDGQVVEKTDKLVTVKYKDNSIQSIRIGKQYGRMEGSIYPHDIVSKLTVGSKFKQNDYLAYNANFFEEDWLDPSKLIMKFGKNVTVALAMTNEVYEDSSAISTKLSEEMSTYVIKEKIYILDFNKNVINLLQEGTTVEPNTVLFSAIDNETDYTNLSESSIEMLQGLASLSPRAKYNGTIERYEIKYNGELSDMSPSLKKLATKLDRQLYEESKGTEYEARNNQVTSEYRSEGKNLNVDTLELKVFIRVKLGQKNGDKGSFSNQMKSVICDVFTESIRTESGLDIDAIFSFQGCLNRGVLSPVIIGTTNRLLKHVSQQVADAYFGK